MASCMNNAFLFSFFLTTTIWLPSIVVTGAKPDLVHKVCSKTIMPCFCLQELRSDARSKGANFTSLAGIVLDKIEPRVNSMKNAIDSLLKKGDLPVKQQLRLSTCLDSCNGALVDITWCRHALNLGSGDFKGLKSQAYSLFKHFKKCDKLFKKPPAEPPKIEEASEKIQELCSAVLVISKLGMHKHHFDVCSGFNCVRP